VVVAFVNAIRFEMAVKSDCRNSDDQILDVFRHRLMGILEYY